MINSVNVIENFLSIDECNSILSRCKEDLNLSEGKVYNGNQKDRKSLVGWIDDLGDINERLKNVLKNSYNIGGMEASGLGSFQFTQYNVGDFFKWHSDRTDVFKERFVSTVIQLNDDYVGGLLEFKNSKGEMIPIEHKIGSLYVFDSALRHRVTSVESGTRYSLVNWVSLIKSDLKKQNIL